MEDPATLTDRELTDLLERLGEDERRSSVRRRKLHELIRYRKTMGGADGQAATEKELADLDEQERELSRGRKELHARIDELSRERGRRKL